MGVSVRMETMELEEVKKGWWNRGPKKGLGREEGREGIDGVAVLCYCVAGELLVLGYSN